MAHNQKFKVVTLTLTAADRDRLTDDETNSEASIIVPWFEIHFPSGNAGAAYIGDETVGSAWIPRTAGTTVSYNASERGDYSMGDDFNLKSFYIAGTAGDTVIVQYPARDPVVL